jgi:hypothetical protein
MKTEKRIVYKLNRSDWVNSVISDDNTITLVLTSMEQNSTSDVMIQFPVELINDILIFAKRAGDIHNKHGWDGSTEKVNEEIEKFLNRNNEDIQIPFQNSSMSMGCEDEDDWSHLRYTSF